MTDQNNTKVSCTSHVKEGFVVTAGIRVPDSSSIFTLVKKVCSAGSFLGNKYNRQNAELSKAIWNNKGPRSEGGDYEKRTNFCNWYLQAVATWRCSGPKLTSTDKAWFHLTGCISRQNNSYWSSINPRQTFEVALHDQKIGVWCVHVFGTSIV
jgi:hypothetical protein